VAGVEAHGMTREEAERLAALCYGGHPAAPVLMVESVHGQTEDARRRAAVALVVLDPQTPLVVVEAMADRAIAPPPEDEQPPPPLEGTARAIAHVFLLASYSSDRRKRVQIWNLMERFLTDANRVMAAETAA
jgi:hypothetical protein